MGRPPLARPRIRLQGNEHPESIIAKATTALEKKGETEKAFQYSHTAGRLLAQFLEELRTLTEQYVDIQ